MLSDIFDFWNIILYVINCVAQFAKLIFTTPLLIFAALGFILFIVKAKSR